MEWLTSEVKPGVSENTEGKEERVWSKDDCCCGVRSIEVGFLGEVLK